MIVTVLWEDQRAAGKGFGPHELLVSCLADELATEASTLKKRVRSHPKKGNAKVLADLKLNAARLRNSGPLFAVIDRDKVRKLWSAADAPTDCLSGLGKHFHRDAPGDYELVFLIQNVESLLDIAADVLGEAKLRSKPSPDERDGLFQRCTSVTSEVRLRIRQGCPSFERLVQLVAKALRPGEVSGGGT